MTATVPTSNSSPLASAQSLRLRHGRLSPLRLGIYGLVSLGSHLLLLGLFRWAWQVQLAIQPVGSPIGIDFVEVDLSDGSFEGQLPDESDGSSVSSGKLSAAQLNELIAQGDSAPTDTIPETDVSELGQSEVFPDGGASPETVAAVNDTAANPSQTSGGELEQPRRWFPFGQSKEREGNELFGDRPPLLPTNQSPATPKSSNDTSDANSGTGTATTVADAPSNNSSGDASPEAPQTETSAPANNSDQAVETTTDNSNGDRTDDSPATDSTAPVTPSSDSPDEPASTQSSGADSTGSDNSSGGNSSNSPGRPNELPPNQSERPVSPDQTIQPDETSQPQLNPGDNAPENPPNSGGTEVNNQPELNPGNNAPENLPNGGGTDINNPEGVNGNSGGDSAGDGSSNSSGESDSSATTPGSTEEAAETGGTAGSESSEAVTRLGANLVVDEFQSRALNTQDVFTRLPRPLGDPLSSGSQSVNSGRCANQLAQLTPASYGQSVQLKLAVDVSGQVFWVEGVGAQAQTAVGQAIACIAEEWPFEPAQRVIDEGGVEKIEDAGAVLFVTVTISLLE